MKKRRADRLLKKTLQNSLVAAIIVVILFGGMAGFLWKVGNTTRILDKYSIFAKLSPSSLVSEQGAAPSRSSEIIAVMVLHGNRELLEVLQEQKEITLILPVSDERHSWKTTVLQAEQLKDGSVSGNQSLVLKIRPAPGQRIEDMRNLLFEDTYRNMVIAVRTKSLWQAVMER